MAFIRLLHRQSDGEIVFRKTTSGDVPAYAILSHTWGDEEVIFQDMEAGADSKTVSKAGWEKIQFCAKQAAADGLQYFWVDTCCIDKKNAVELGAAINSMFRWYQNAARCYVYLSDVSKSTTEAVDERVWEEALRKSRWFTRGWTLQELIAPRLVDFFSLEGERLGNKSTLAAIIHEITGIEKNALQGNALSNFTIKDRRSWAEHRKTTVEEDAAYCLIGIFDVSMVPNYGERKDQAFRRLEEEIHKLYKGVDFEQFAVRLNLTSFPEAAQFVAREKELSKMHELLYGHSNRACIVLYGLGGIGKTQLPIEYIRRHKEKYTAIFWLNANDQDSLKLSFRDIAQQVLKYHPSTSLLAGVDLDDLDQVMYAVKAWLDLQKNTRWLIIYDNYDNPKTPGNLDCSAVDIRQFLPGSDQGSIIITTRSSRVSQGRRIHVQKLLDIKEGLEILSNTSRRKNIAKDLGAVELAKELDGLPLALSTAGAYLEHVTTSFSDYLRLYKASWLKLQKTSPQLSSYEDRSLYTTWQITFDRIQQLNPASASLLKLWAYFDRQDVWFELLRYTNSLDNRWIQELIEDELNFNEAIALLCSFGLVDPDGALQQQFGSGGYSVHSCVYSWTVSVLNKEWDKSFAQLALRCVASKIPMKNKTDSWILQRRLLQHAVRQEQAILEDKVDIEEMEWALHNLGNLYTNQGKLAEAEAMYTRALQG
ncbi:HET-domain-containing protein, partial [Mollisia scopiformis]